MLPVIFFFFYLSRRRGSIQVDGSVVLQIHGLSETSFGFLYPALHV